MEDFLWQSSDLLGRLDEMREDLSANDFADDVGTAKTAVDVHMESRRKVVKVPVENMDNVGQRHGFCVLSFLPILLDFLS